MQNKNVSLEAIRTIVKEEIRPIEDNLRKDFHEKMDKILDSNDKLSVKLDKILIELPVTAHRQDKQDKKIDSLDARVGNLETQVSVA